MSHYDKDYFDWQKHVGKIGGHLNKFKFETEVKDHDILMDFGCGGGFLLNQFQNKQKIGFEINKHAHEQCKQFGIQVYDDFNDICDNSIDVVISNHALEHVPLPLESLTQLHKKVKNNGKVVIVVPCEQPYENGFDYRENDQNQHLHTWCPMTLGNLAKLAGFNVKSCTAFHHQWCPDYQENWNKPDFHKRCYEYAKKRKNYQIRLVAIKP